VLESNGLKCGSICREELGQDCSKNDQLSDDLHGDGLANCLKRLHITSIKEDEDDLTGYNNSLIPTFIPLYINYIQQDGKL